MSKEQRTFTQQEVKSIFANGWEKLRLSNATHKLSPPKSVLVELGFMFAFDAFIDFLRENNLHFNENNFRASAQALLDGK